MPNFRIGNKNETGNKNLRKSTFQLSNFPLAVQTEEPTTEDVSVQTNKSASILEVSEVVQTDLPQEVPGPRVQSRYDQIGQRMDELFGPGWDKT